MGEQPALRDSPERLQVLLDRFATDALHGLLGACAQSGARLYQPDHAAELAYQYAHALMVERAGLDCMGERVNRNGEENANRHTEGERDENGPPSQGAGTTEIARNSEERGFQSIGSLITRLGHTTGDTTAGGGESRKTASGGSPGV